ncbi:MAG: phenylalanine--tRNA ligase subunit beta [Candidatus Omnitrophota bacterium]|nr:phenylalanine--tRNA ligase subunit beta [Candidatus Omnitrophota bacterium]
MKFTYNWLKEFVELKLTPEKLAEKLTMAGLEVKSLQAKDGDFILEIEITSNRPDWLSVVGIAREVAAITGKRLKIPKLVNGPQSMAHGSKARGKTGGLSTVDYRRVSIKIEDIKDCPLYTAKIIRDVLVRPSPEWLKKRLELIGCRSINNVVDITNYIMFTYGEPLHAFDLDKLNTERIVIRRARKGEKISNIDQVERILNEDILVIADEQKPVAIAGVMGGKDTEVDERTRSILLEAAIFDPVVIRRGRRLIGMQSESSYRFERGVDFDTASGSSLLATQLILELAQGSLVSTAESGTRHPELLKIELNPQEANRVLGIQAKKAEIKKMLEHLGFFVQDKRSGLLTVRVPLFRQDVKKEVDLIEEVARIYGYENIPTTVALITPRVGFNQNRELVGIIKNTLVGLNLNEAITYSLISRNLLFGFSDENLVKILNPLSQEQEILRPALLPGLLKVVSHNLNQKQLPVNIFEIAKGFSSGVKTPKEELLLSICLCGIEARFSSQGQIKDRPGLLHLKGILSQVLRRLGISNYSFKLNNNECADLYVQGQLLGRLFKLSQEALDKFDIKNTDVFTANLFLDKVFNLADLSKNIVPLPKYPAIVRDLSIVVKSDLAVDKIIQEIEKSAGDLFREVKVIDYYQGKQIPCGFRGITLSCLYRSDARTLTEEDISALHTAIVNILQDKFQAGLR